MSPVASRSLRFQALAVALQARTGAAPDDMAIATLRQLVEAEGEARDRVANAAAQFLAVWPQVRRDPDRICSEGGALHDALCLPLDPPGMNRSDIHG